MTCVRIGFISGLVTTLVGSYSGYADGQGGNARFNNPRAVAVDTRGFVYVADQGNHRIRLIRPINSTGI